MFKLGDIVFDRLQYGYAESLTDGTPLYLLSHLQEATIEVSSEAEEKTDENGNLIRKIYKSKAGTLSAVNAMINTKIMEQQSGSAAVFATNDAPVVMPKITVVKASDGTVTLENLVAGTVKVSGYYAEGGISSTAFEMATTADATHYAVTSDGKLSLPTGNDFEYYMVKYDRNVKEGAKLSNSTKKFPKAVRLFLKGLYYDPCNKGYRKSAYIELPSFQVSPDVNLELSTEATMDYSGDLETDFCSISKDLYHVYLANDDEEDED